MTFAAGHSFTEQPVSDRRVTMRNVLLLLLLATPLGIGTAVVLYVLLPPDSFGVLAALPVCGLVLLAVPIIYAFRHR